MRLFFKVNPIKKKTKENLFKGAPPQIGRQSCPGGGRAEG